MIDCFEEIDKIIKLFQIKFVFVESGNISIEDKIEEIQLEKSKIDSNWKYWIELSWGSGDEEDKFECACNSFGKSFGDAFHSCLVYFIELVNVDTNQQ